MFHITHAPSLLILKILSSFLVTRTWCINFKWNYLCFLSTIIWYNLLVEFSHRSATARYFLICELNAVGTSLKFLKRSWQNCFLWNLIQYFEIDQFMSKEHECMSDENKLSLFCVALLSRLHFKLCRYWWCYYI